MAVFSIFTFNVSFKYIFLFVTTNTWYDSAKHYKIHQRGHLIDKKNLSMVKWVKYGPLTLLFAVTHKTDFFLQLFALLL